MSDVYSLQHTAEAIDEKLCLINKNINLLKHPYTDTNFEEYPELEDVGDGSIMITETLDHDIEIKLNKIELSPGQYVLFLYTADNIIMNSGGDNSCTGFCELIIQYGSDTKKTYGLVDELNLSSATEPIPVSISLKFLADTPGGSLFKPAIINAADSAEWKGWTPYMNNIGTYVDRRFNSTNTKIKVLADYLVKFSDMFEIEEIDD